MTVDVLQSRVTAAVAAVGAHADVCKALVERSNLEGAIEHCKQQCVEAPQSPLTARITHDDCVKALRGSCRTKVRGAPDLEGRHAAAGRQQGIPASMRTRAWRPTSVR